MIHSTAPSRHLGQPAGGADETDQEPQGREEVQLIANPMATEDGLTELQELILAVQCEANTGAALHESWRPPVGPTELA